MSNALLHNNNNMSKNNNNNDLLDNVILVPFSLCFNYDDILDIFEYFLVYLNV